MMPAGKVRTDRSLAAWGSDFPRCGRRMETGRGAYRQSADQRGCDPGMFLAWHLFILASKGRAGKGPEVLAPHANLFGIGGVFPDVTTGAGGETPFIIEKRGGQHLCARH